MLVKTKTGNYLYIKDSEIKRAFYSSEDEKIEVVFLDKEIITVLCSADEANRAVQELDRRMSIRPALTQEEAE
jgi:hypothetical protein